MQDAQPQPVFTEVKASVGASIEQTPAGANFKGNAGVSVPLTVKFPRIARAVISFFSRGRGLTVILQYANSNPPAVNIVRVPIPGGVLFIGKVDTTVPSIRMTVIVPLRAALLTFTTLQLTQALQSFFP